MSAGDVSFNVSYWTNYSVGEGGSAGENICGVLDQENGQYNLTADISISGTCFIVTADNIILDCKGYKVNYSQSSVGFVVNATDVNFFGVNKCYFVQDNENIVN